MMNTLTVYLAVRMHYGHIGEAIRMSYNDYTRNVLIKIRDNNHSHSNYTQALLDTVKYLYATGLYKYPVKLMSNNPSLIRIMNHLQAWMKQGWPISLYTSHELFIHAQKRGYHRISLRYIPRNHVEDVQLYQRIVRGFSYFKSPLKLNYCYPDNDEMAMLNAFVWNKIKDLHPTSSFLNHTYAHDADLLKSDSSDEHQILVSPMLKARFKSICDSSAKSPLHVLRSLVVGYIKSNGGSGNRYNWKHDLYHRIIRCAKIAFSWNDMLKKLNSYGVHANIFRNQYIKTGTGKPFLNDIHYSFIDKRGHHINVYGKDLSSKLTITALTKLITKNTEHQFAHQH